MGIRVRLGADYDWRALIVLCLLVVGLVIPLSIVNAIGWHRQVAAGSNRVGLRELLNRPALFRYFLHGLFVFAPVLIIVLAVGMPISLAINEMMYSEQLIQYDAWWRVHVFAEDYMPSFLFRVAMSIFGFAFVSVALGKNFGFWRSIKGGWSRSAGILSALLLLEALYFCLSEFFAKPLWYALFETATDPGFVWTEFAYHLIAQVVVANLSIGILTRASMDWQDKEEPARLAGVFE